MKRSAKTVAGLLVEVGRNVDLAAWCLVVVGELP